MVNTEHFTGDLACGKFCFDFRFVEDGYNGVISHKPNFTIFSGEDVLTAELRATYTHPTAYNQSDGWQKNICTTILIPGSAPPTNWEMTVGNDSDWNTLISDVGGVAFTTDYPPPPDEEATVDERIAIDNFCFTADALQAIPRFHIENQAGEEQVEFCDWQDVYVDGAASTNEEAFKFSIWKRPLGSSEDFAWASTMDAFIPGEVATHNLTEFFQTSASPAISFEQGYEYQVRLIVTSICTDWAWTSNTFVIKNEPTPIFHFENVLGEIKDTFCFGEVVMLNGLASLDETTYFVEIGVYDPQGVGQDWPQSGNTWVPFETPYNLTELMWNDIDNDEDGESYFKPGYTYRIKLSVGNECNLWVEDTKEFVVECCDSSEPNPRFSLEPLPSDPGTITFTAANYGLYEDLGAVHEWFVYSSPTLNGPFTPLAVYTGQSFIHGPVETGLFYFVIHRVTTECGEYCYQERIGGSTLHDPPSGSTRDRGTEETGKPCGLINDIFPSCDDLDIPIGLDVAGATLTWMPVQGAINYTVYASVGPDNSCKCEGDELQVDYNLGTTTETFIPVPDFLFETCFEWRVEAHCETGSSLSDPACYAAEFFQEDPRERSASVSAILGEAVIKTEIFPNPSHGAVTFSIHLKQACTLGIEVLNSNGQLVTQLDFGEVKPGFFQRTWQPDLTLGAGAYLVKFTAGTVVKTEKIVILK